MPVHAHSLSLCMVSMPGRSAYADEWLPWAAMLPQQGDAAAAWAQNWEVAKTSPAAWAKRRLSSVDLLAVDVYGRNGYEGFRRAQPRYWEDRLSLACDHNDDPVQLQVSSRSCLSQCNSSARYGTTCETTATHAGPLGWRRAER